jgi:hypothetical protein
MSLHGARAISATRGSATTETAMTATTFTVPGIVECAREAFMPGQAVLRDAGFSPPA